MNLDPEMSIIGETSKMCGNASYEYCAIDKLNHKNVKSKVFAPSDLMYSWSYLYEFIWITSCCLKALDIITLSTALQISTVCIY